MTISRKRPLAALLVGALLLALTTLSLAPAHAAPASKTGYFAGKLINPGTGKPVKGATVRVFRINTDDELGSAKSDKHGKFRINRLDPDEEELDVRVNGRAVRYETGWVGCGRNVVVSWAAACSFAQGNHLPFKLQHL
jgi:hypothetical protein